MVVILWQLGFLLLTRQTVSVCKWKMGDCDSLWCCAYYPECSEQDCWPSAADARAAVQSVGEQGADPHGGIKKDVLGAVDPSPVCSACQEAGHTKQSCPRQVSEDQALSHNQGSDQARDALDKNDALRGCGLCGGPGHNRCTRSSSLPARTFYSSQQS